MCYGHLWVRLSKTVGESPVTEQECSGGKKNHSFGEALFLQI
jgi:hypothetical protein